MSNDAASAMGAERCQLVDGTLETVECVCASGHYDLKGFGVVVATGIAFLFHGAFRLVKRREPYCTVMRANLRGTSQGVVKVMAAPVPVTAAA
jgi:hypothetical protein